jgi:ankyrin repeat protein
MTRTIQIALSVAVLTGVAAGQQKLTGPKAGETRGNLKDGQQYVWVPAGAFAMGCSPVDGECGRGDPNLAWGELNDAPLHLAAERWDVPMIELLVHHGADIHRRREDGRTAYSVAALHGNGNAAVWLLAHGAEDELSLLERFVSACARGDRMRATKMLQANPDLRHGLTVEHHLLMHVPAERGDAVVLETMLASGFQPNVKDRDGVTPLHRAAMGGHTEAVRVLLAYGASVHSLDGMFSGTPLLWASHGWRNNPHQTHCDYLGVARQLIAAGSSVEWIPPEKAPDPEGAQEELSELCRAAAGAS